MTAFRLTPKGSNAGRKRGNTPLLNLEQRQMIRALFDAGAKYRELAEQFACSIGTIQRVVSYHAEQKDAEESRSTGKNELETTNNTNGGE